MATYTVTGAQHRVLGHGHGETFDAELDPVQEARLIQAGHLERVDAAEKSAQKKKDEGDK